SKGLGRRPLACARRRRAKKNRRYLREGDAAIEISRRRHGGIPLRGRRVLFHRDEHPHPGRTSRHRDDHRYRHRALADPHRGRRWSKWWWTASRLRCSCSARWSGNPPSSTATITSTGSSSTWQVSFASEPAGPARDAKSWQPSTRVPKIGRGPGTNGTFRRSG